jgi:hypothetical protein
VPLAPKASDCKLDAENQRLKPPKLGWVRMGFVAQPALLAGGRAVK